MLTAKSSKKICLLLSFLLPLGIMAAVSTLCGFYPFGDRSVLMADMRYQFVDYYAAYNKIFFGNDDLFYTFSKTFGGDMSGLFAYYCNTPLLFLLAFVPNRALPGGILILMSLMLGLCSLHFYLFLNETFGFRISSLIFSVAYAFTGYMTGYFNCTQYFYSVALLPLVMLGLIRIIRTGRVSILYIVSLFLTVFSNYYIGYMICVFSLLFFAFQYFLRYTDLQEVKEHVRSFLLYAVSSVLAVGMSAVSLFCAVFSLRGQKSGGLPFSAKLNFNPLDLFSGLYTNAFHGNLSDGLPLIYCGVLGAVLCLLFFLNRNIGGREKLLTAALFLVLIASFLFDPLNVAWHGFAHPIGFPYRFSFLFSFFALYTAYVCFLHIGGAFSLRHYVFVLVCFLLYSGYLLLSHNQYAGLGQIIITLCFLLPFLACVHLCQYGRQYMLPVILGMGLLSCADEGYNAYQSIGSYFSDLFSDEEYSMKAYTDFIDETGGMIETLSEQDPSLYRIEKHFRRSNNDAMMFGYPGLSHFSSTETEAAKRFMGALGFRDNGNWAYYGEEGSTTFADCLMGVKYLLSQYDTIPRPYTPLFTENGRYAFRNPYALPLAFLTKQSAEEVLPSDAEDLFTFQNTIAASFTGTPHDIYRKVKDVTVKTENLTVTDSQYRKTDPEKDAWIDFSFTADSGDLILMHFDAPDRQDTRIIVNGLEKQPYFTDYGWNIRAMGFYQEGEAVTLRMELLQDQIEVTGFSFYYEDWEELKRWYEDVSADQVNLTKEKSSRLSGRAEPSSPEKTLLVFSIPYDKNWRITVDGTKASPVEAFGGFLAVEIPAGREAYTFTLRYLPAGFLPGLFVTIVSFGIFLLFICFDMGCFRREKKL